MTIPAILPYPMPTEADLAPSAARWRPDPRRAAVLVHDLQRYFVGFLPPGAPPTTTLIDNVVRLKRAAALHHIPVIYTAPGPMTRAQRGLLHDFWGEGMGSDPGQRQILPEVAPGPGDMVLDKYRYSAFHRTGLAGTLARLRRDQLLICGVYAHVGCLSTAIDALAHDIEAFLIADALADFSREDHLSALDYAARQCAVTLTTDRVLGALAGSFSPR